MGGRYISTVLFADLRSFTCVPSTPCPRARIRLEWAGRGEAMNRWHNHYLNTPAHALPATVRTLEAEGASVPLPIPRRRG